MTAVDALRNASVKFTNWQIKFLADCTLHLWKGGVVVSKGSCKLVGAKNLLSL